MLRSVSGSHPQHSVGPGVRVPPLATTSQVAAPRTVAEPAEAHAVRLDEHSGRPLIRRKVMVSPAPSAPSSSLGAKPVPLGTGELLRRIAQREARHVDAASQEMLDDYLREDEWGEAFELLSACLSYRSIDRQSVIQLMEVSKRLGDRSR